MRRPLAMAGAVIAALALGLVLRPWVFSEVEVTEVARGSARTTASGPSSGSIPAPDLPSAATAVQPLATSPAPPSVSTAGVPVSLTVTSPRKLLVGEIGELVVSVAPNADVAEIGFVAQFDANVLQARGNVQGDWAVSQGVSPRFVVETSTAEDRVRVRSTRASPLTGTPGGSVALVQFQGLVVGTTTVLVTDVAAKDAAGRSLVATVSASNLQVTVDSLPPPSVPALSR